MTGIVLGGLFDCYRVLRGTFNPRILITWFTDLLYWLVATAIVFIALVFSNWGELRLYVFIGILGGLGLYYNWLSLYVIRLFSKTIKLIIAGLFLIKKFFIGVFLTPGVYCMRKASWPFLFIGHKIIVWCRTRWAIPSDKDKR
jgi:spore cortex biosynthesis protein YabQ